MGTQKYQILRQTIAGILAVVTLQGCTSAGKSVYGRVINADTGQPIQGAYVFASTGYYKCNSWELGMCGCVDVDGALTQTNANGYFSFNKSFDFGGSILSDKFGSVAVFKPGFKNIKSNYKNTETKDTNGLKTYKHYNIYHQYFYGTGMYGDEYKKFPLEKGSNNFMLRKINYSNIDTAASKGTSPVFFYISEISYDLVGHDCFNGETNKFRKAYEKFYHYIRLTAKQAITTREDKKKFWRVFESKR
ncbi:hypothetical protein [Salinisphaera sp.]|uniref:hypothetical protein n=1 Tax=Salinisphaera sp. TaxID=1914330 RepID=UPI002D77D2CB|nr:hypothetical protein [Salinisphaera sp.]HET7314194.1 hypothetical protein [Salinisphaera sp.]